MSDEFDFSGESPFGSADGSGSSLEDSVLGGDRLGEDSGLRDFRHSDEESFMEIDLDQTAFECGGLVTGTVRWSGPKEPRSVWVKLVYRTEGRGNQNSGEPVEVPVPAGRSGHHSFELRVPEVGPMSFDGNLISLSWAVNLKLDIPRRRDIHEYRRITILPQTV